MNQKTENRPSLDSAADGDEGLLAQYSLSHLPEVFALRNEDNSIIQERAACYVCNADGFYGKGTHGTWYPEGSIIVTDVVPNLHMEPLNRAAAIKHARWQSALPNNRAPIDVGDMSEAAIMLSKDPRCQQLGPGDYQKAVIRLAEELKLKREGKDARDLPAMGHNFTPQSGGKAPPILGAKMSDLTQRGPGATMAQAAGGVGGPPGVRRAQAAPPAALGGAAPR